MSSSDLDALGTVCRKISLNIPDHCPWRWDREFNLALTVIDKQDEIMIELPITLEFNHKWDFSTISGADAPVRDFFQSGFGVVPGQKLFTMDPLQGMVLFAAWWPWGDDERISLRLGLLSITDQKLDSSDVKRLICGWLGIE
ncbi:hypothetical protein [uncultured Desulfosarcina sp.]|uniref:hypothetical protein n=1 Tax=uncultured Desulfosarcina sp. TaxID=218289 RepID=UPI0029C82266|nr:hypothetical protein [uncultured Desulfosarcina sp.]